MNLKTKTVSAGSKTLNQQNLSGGLSTKQISASITNRETIDNSNLKNFEHTKVDSQILSQQNLCAGIGTKQINANLAGGSWEIKDHSKLKNLEYIKSGHTGFAGIEFGTIAEWNSKRTYRPVEGMLVVYTDYQSYTNKYGQTIYVPGFKVGDGNAYLIDKPFVGEADSILLRRHIEDIRLHIQPGEREFWNNKLNYEEPEGDLLIFTKN